MTSFAYAVCIVKILLLLFFLNKSVDTCNLCSELYLCAVCSFNVEIIFKDHFLFLFENACMQATTNERCVPACLFMFVKVCCNAARLENKEGFLQSCFHKSLNVSK